MYKNNLVKEYKKIWLPFKLKETVILKMNAYANTASHSHHEYSASLIRRWIFTGVDKTVWNVEMLQGINKGNTAK